MSQHVDDLLKVFCGLAMMKSPNGCPLQMTPFKRNQEKIPDPTKIGVPDFTHISIFGQLLGPWFRVKSQRNSLQDILQEVKLGRFGESGPFFKGI